MKKVLFLLLLSVCSCSFININLGGESKNAIQKPMKELSYQHLTSDDLSIYMGYQSAIMAGDVNTAENLIKKLIEKYPNFVEPYIDLINIYIFEKRLEEAIKLVEEVEKTKVESDQLLMAKANIYLMKGDTNLAIPILKKIITLHPERENIYLLLANIYFQNKRYDDAKGILDELLKIYPNSFLGNLYLGKIYETIEDNEKAAFYFEKAFKEREEDEILINLDRLYDKLGQRLKSIDVLEKFLVLNPDYPKVRERLALLYLGENNYQKALEHLEILLKDFPDNIDLNFKAAFSAIEGGFYDKASNFLDIILKKEPQNQKALYFYGLLYKDQKKWNEAIKYFENVTDEEYSKSSKLYLSICYEKIGRKDKAKEILENYWVKEKDEEVGYFLAMYYKNVKDYDNALKFIDDILTWAKEKDIYNRLVFLKAEIFLKKDKFKDAIMLVEDLLKRFPDDPDALNFLGYSLAEKGLELDKAEAYILKALEKKPEDPYITDSLAWVYYMKGEYKKALELQEKALKKIKNDPTILEHYGDILRALGKDKEAKKYYVEALENDPEEPDKIRKKIEEIKD